MLHDILARHRPMEFGPAVLTDFTLDAGRMVGADTLRYNELNSDPLGSAKALLRLCNLPSPGVDALNRVFAKDSQTGTQIARDRRTSGFGPENYARFRVNLERAAPGLDPDLVLPHLAN